MNSKEVKAEKKLKKSKSKLKNGGQQVFVLPPNLLQKLGINLGNVECTPSSPDMGYKQSNSIQERQCEDSTSNAENLIISNNINNETSIVQTASLMKESVFLSPTFNTSNLNNTDSHVESCMDTDNAEISCSTQKECSNSVLEYEFVNNKKLNDNCNDIGCDKSLSIDTNTLEMNGSTTSEKPIMENDTKRVVNIISEETVTAEKLNELKVLQKPPKIAMIPASLTTIIGKSLKQNKISSDKISSTFNNDITDNMDLQNNYSDDNLISTEIEMSDTENIVNMDLKIYCNTESICSLANSENHMLNFQRNKCISENVEQKIDSSPFSNENSHIILETISDSNLDDPIIERNSEYSPGQIIHEMIDKELMLANQDFKDSIQSLELNNSYEKQEANIDKHLENNYTDAVTQVNSKESESEKICDLPQNVKYYISDIITANNNNTWNHNKSDVNPNEIPIHTDTCVENDPPKNMETICSRIDEDNADNTEELCFINKVMEQHNLTDNTTEHIPVSSQNNECMVADTQVIIASDIINDNLICLSETLLNNDSLSDIIDGDDINEIQQPLNPESDYFMSKLCRQGVEKPGGIETDSKKIVILKTYSNNRIREKYIPPEKNKNNINFEHDSNIDLSERTSPDTLHCQQFCDCYDYGVLDYNEIENNYEHIHFTTKNSLCCNPDVIFGIYDDEMLDITETRKNLDFIEDTRVQINSKDSEYSICWHNAGHNTFETDFENSRNQEKVLFKSSKVPHSGFSNDRKIDYDIQVSTINDPKQNLIESCFNRSQGVMNVAAVREADSKYYTKNGNRNSNGMVMENPSGCYSNNLDLESRKRKISNTSTEQLNNKRVKKNIALEVGESSVQNQTNDQVEGNALNNSEVQEENDEVTNDTINVKCAICNMNVANAEWFSHIASTHDYIAWKEGEPPVDLENEDAIRIHLHQIGQELGHLECSNCGLTRKYAKSFLHHILRCYDSEDTNNQAQLPYHLSKLVQPPTIRKCDNCGQEYNNAKEYSIHMKKCLRRNGHSTRSSTENAHEQLTSTMNVTCGVCKEEMPSHQWITHIQREHGYLAWRDGETPLNIEDVESVRKHLYMIQQDHGALVCSKCGKSRKYVKLFLQHIESCTGQKENDNALDTSCVTEWESILDTSLDDTGAESRKLVKCGRCHLEMESRQWIDHIQEQHNYMSWQEGQTPLDLNDEEALRRYLYVVVHKVGTLACAKCGVARRYVKSYLSHVETCRGPATEPKAGSSMEATSSQRNITTPLATTDSKDRPGVVVKCGVCQKEMNDSSWIAHIGMNHEYIAWKEMEPPINTSNYEAIWIHLTNILKDIGSLKCADCGRRCKYAKAFLLHIKNCYGKTYVEIDEGNNTLNQSMSDSDGSDSSGVSEEDGSAAVTCGACGDHMEARRWLHHMHAQHNYLAWRAGKPPLDLENIDSIRTHLKNIQRMVKKLVCAKCGVTRRKAVSFYTHVKDCDGSTNALDNSLRNMKSTTEKSDNVVKCAVCHAEVKGTAWIDHIAKEHDYMAWRDGDSPLKLDDEVEVKEHLYKISQTARGLKCSKCGQIRKYVKSYLQHVRGCTGPEESTDGSNKTAESKKDVVEVVTCALCRLDMDDSKWMDHISKEHNYVSWKQNEPSLTFKDETALRDYLYSIVQSIGSLTCSKCGLVRKYAKSYLMHIETCQRVTWKTINKNIMKLNKEKGDMVRCAVCSAEVDDTEWLQHIAAQHRYLAWRDRDPPLNLQDEDEVRRHLKNIIDEEGYLKCPKCNVHRKYAKLYLDHVNRCDGTKVGADSNESMNETKPSLSDTDEDEVDESAVVKCGVCAQEVVRAQWISHIEKEHKYLAWQEGKEPIDVNDQNAVYRHLSALSGRRGGLTCGSCGLLRKYVKSYLRHVRDCTDPTQVHSEETIDCGVCGENMVAMLWRDHAMQVHYNIAWVDGETPIDLRNFFSVDKYLKEYQEYNHKLVCNICGLCRASLAGFYAHILICGKTDEEVDRWKDVCDICNQKYLCIYKTQHYWTHRVQEVAKERKIQQNLKREKKDESLKEEANCTPGRRRAAEKARSVIGHYAAKLSGFKCQTCPYETDIKEDLVSHRCPKRALNDDSDDSVSIKLEDFSEEESEGSVASGVSSEEEAEPAALYKDKKFRNESSGARLAAKWPKFPFDVKDARPYLQQSKHDHFKLFYTREILFPTWRNYPYEVVSDEVLSKYIPQLEESCKVSISNGEWATYKRFESRKENGCKVLFTGGSIQCIAWAPEHPDDTPDCHSLLAVASHRGADCPRLQITDTPSHPALVQMWNFHSFTSIPELAFGLALDFGTIWAMDWCPSGARDPPDSVTSDDNAGARLGLLAVACSNGSAYVISVPNLENSKTGEHQFYKIKPCVELRMTRGSNKYQATSINWSLFKGYTTISVGYGDGSVALYDLVTESPLLTAKEGDMDILYPYQDERLHNSCVTGLTSCVLGAWCSSSATGSTAGVPETGLRTGRGARPLRTHSGLAASIGTFMPHWPNVMLSGDDTIVGLSPSELEWGYVGRRVGSVRALAACPHRARVSAFIPPLLQALRPHPAAFKGHKTIHKKNVAMLEMIPLAKKRSKHSNDELSMKVEPITYEDAIASYGIEFKFERDFDKAFAHRMQQKHRSPYPERFPLGDVVALAYCPAAAHYTKLALATHAGLLLLFDV